MRSFTRVLLALHVATVLSLRDDIRLLEPDDEAGGLPAMDPKQAEHAPEKEAKAAKLPAAPKTETEPAAEELSLEHTQDTASEVTPEDQPPKDSLEKDLDKLESEVQPAPHGDEEEQLPSAVKPDAIDELEDELDSEQAAEEAPEAKKDVTKGSGSFDLFGKVEHPISSSKSAYKNVGGSEFNLFGDPDHVTRKESLDSKAQVSRHGADAADAVGKTTMDAEEAKHVEDTIQAKSTARAKALEKEAQKTALEQATKDKELEASAQDAQRDAESQMADLQKAQEAVQRAAQSEKETRAWAQEAVQHIQKTKPN